MSVDALSGAPGMLSPEEKTAPYETLFRESPFGMFVIDRRGCIAECNAAFLSMAGASREQVIGFDLIASVRDAVLIPHLRAAMGGQRVELETPYTSTTGNKTSDYRFVFQPLGGAGPLAVIAYVEDIAGRKSSERALAKARDELERRVAERTAELLAAESRYRALVEQSLAGVYVISAGRIVYANPMMCTIFGYSKEEITGIAVADLVAPEDRARIAENVRRRVAGEISELRYVFTGLRKNGQRIDIEVHGSLAELDGKPAVIGILLDISERHKLEQALNHLAYFDPLTELPNRKMFFDRLETLTAVARRSDARLAVLFIDLDGFKGVNDQHGHRTGDQLLVGVAEALLASVRTSDTVARLGGDEFALILTQINQPEDVCPIAEHVEAAVRALTLTDGSNAGISASIGISLFPEHSAETDALLQLADQAMYEVKNSGKGSYRFSRA